MCTIGSGVGGTNAVSMNGGDGGGAGKSHAERLGDCGHGRGGAHDGAGASGGDEAALGLLELVGGLDDLLH